MRICIDARRVDESGIGRSTTNLLVGLSGFDLDHEFVLIVDDSRPPGDHINRRNCELVRLAGHPFSKAGIHSIPAIIREKLIDLFISPHSYGSPFVECPSIEFIHDLWPIIHPEWIPTRYQLAEKYGGDAVIEMDRISEHFRAHFESGIMLPRNRFLNQGVTFEDLKNPRLFMIAMLTFAITRASRVVVPSQRVRDEVRAYFPKSSIKFS